MAHGAHGHDHHHKAHHGMGVDGLPRTQIAVGRQRQRNQGHAQKQDDIVQLSLGERPANKLVHLVAACQQGRQRDANTCAHGRASHTQGAQQAGQQQRHLRSKPRIARVAALVSDHRQAAHNEQDPQQYKSLVQRSRHAARQRADRKGADARSATLLVRALAPFALSAHQQPYAQSHTQVDPQAHVVRCQHFVLWFAWVN